MFSSRVHMSFTLTDFTTLITSSQNNFHRNPIFLYYFTYLLHFILPVHGSSFTFYTFHISNMYILFIIMHSIFLYFSFFNDAYSKKQLLVYDHGAAIYPELRSDNFSLSLLPGTFPQQFPYCCIHLQPDGWFPHWYDYCQCGIMITENLFSFYSATT